MNVTVNLESFRRDLADAGEKLVTGMKRGVAEGCAHIERAAKQNLKGDPRGKHLMSSIHSAVASEGMVVTGQVGVGGATGIDNNFYRYKGEGMDAGENFGIWVHEGTGIYSRTGMGRPDVPWPFIDDEGNTHWTSGMQANPFLENAYNSESGRVARIIADALTGG